VNYAIPLRVVFATFTFYQGANGLEMYERYLWGAFEDDSQIEFHLVASELPGRTFWARPGLPGADFAGLRRRS